MRDHLQAQAEAFRALGRRLKEQAGDTNFTLEVRMVLLAQSLAHGLAAADLDDLAATEPANDQFRAGGVGRPTISETEQRLRRELVRLGCSCQCWPHGQAEDCPLHGEEDAPADPVTDYPEFENRRPLHELDPDFAKRAGIIEP